MSEPLSAALINEAIGWRRQLHRLPELAYRERITSDFVAASLREWGLDVHRGLAGTGVVGTLRRGAHRRTIGIRADMDALPIEEKSTVAHSSQHCGVMHACGHDGHTAILLATARACVELEDIDGTVHFIFQPAEENEQGGKRMVEEGLFRLFPCESIYGLHNWPAIPVGSYVARDGPILGAFAIFEITVSGRGCHGCFPHEGDDVILAAGQLIAALHTIASRSIDPRQAAVVSATQVHGGDTWNTLPDRCVIRGTTRWFDPLVGDTIERRMNELARSIAAGYGCQAQVHYERRIPATVNDPAATEFLRSVVSSTLPQLRRVDIEPSTGAEDFAFMLEHVPGCYVLLGAGRTTGDNPPLHSPQFDFNDEALPLGAALWLELVRSRLGRRRGADGANPDSVAAVTC